MQIPQEGFSNPEIQRMFALALAAGATTSDFRTSVNTVGVTISRSADDVVSRAKKYLAFLEASDAKL